MSKHSTTSCIMSDYSFNLVCIGDSSCGAPYAEREIKRFLNEKTIDYLDKLKTDHELLQVPPKMLPKLTQADLDGLVHCPFCSFAAIMEDPTDRIFECYGCKISSCRYCRVKSHHPLSCESIFSIYRANTRVSSYPSKAIRKTCGRRSNDRGIHPKMQQMPKTIFEGRRM